MSNQHNNNVWTYQGYELGPGNFTTAMVHLYRAEVTRTNLWRSRLDTTTNWAVVTAAAALTFEFSAPTNPHFVLLLVQVLMLTFLFIEARRYRYYQLWYHRVRILETDFFATMMASPYRPPAEWGQALSSSLLDPRFIMPRWRAVGLRLRRIYIWIITIMMVSWVLKLTVHPTSANDIATVIQRAAIGDIFPGAAVVGFAVMSYLALAAVMISSLIVKSPQGVKDYQPSDFQGVHAPHKHAQKQLAIIITDEKDLVAKSLMQDLHRGVTAIPATGMYTGTPRSVLLCAHTHSQSQQLQGIVKAADPAAFLVITEASDIEGRGFSYTEPPD